MRRSLLIAAVVALACLAGAVWVGWPETPSSDQKPPADEPTASTPRRLLPVSPDPAPQRKLERPPPEEHRSPALDTLRERARQLAETPFEPDYVELGTPLDVYDAWMNAVDDRLDLSDAVEDELLAIAQSGDARNAADAMVALADLYTDNADAFQDTPIPPELGPRPAERLTLRADDRAAVQEDKARLLYDMLDFHIAGWPDDHPIRERIRTGRERVGP